MKELDLVIDKILDGTIKLEIEKEYIYFSYTDKDERVLKAIDNKYTKQ